MANLAEPPREMLENIGGFWLKIDGFPWHMGDKNPSKPVEPIDFHPKLTD